MRASSPGDAFSGERPECHRPIPAATASAAATAPQVPFRASHEKERGARSARVLAEENSVKDCSAFSTERRTDAVKPGESRGHLALPSKP